jgi:hypothetical protein
LENGATIMNNKTLLALALAVGCIPIYAQEAPFQASFSILKHVYTQGEPIYVTIEVRNVSGRTIYSPIWTGLTAKRHYFVEIQGPGDAGKPCDRWHDHFMWPFYGTDKFEADYERRDVYMLNQWYEMLEPGQYRLRFVLRADDKPMPTELKAEGVPAESYWVGEVRSEEVVVEVGKAQGIDREALSFLKTQVEELTCCSVVGKIREVINDLHEKFPSSLYTAYALWERHKPDFAPIRGDKPATPQEIVESLLRNARNPVTEHDRSVRPGERKKEIEDLWLILKHQPDFVFLDGVYEALCTWRSRIYRRLNQCSRKPPGRRRTRSVRSGWARSLKP